MASPLQNRLVGTLVVVALAVILLPELFTGTDIQRQDDIEVIPLRPDLDTAMETADFPADFSARTAPVMVDPIVPDDETLSPGELSQVMGETNGAAREVLAEGVPEPLADAERETAMESAAGSDSGAAAVPENVDGWLIQLGAFRNAERVTELVDELQNAGFPAYSRTAGGRGSELTLLLVGPDMDRDELAAQLPELEELTGLEGRIVRYRPGTAEDE